MGTHICPGAVGEDLASGFRLLGGRFPPGIRNVGLKSSDRGRGHDRGRSGRAWSHRAGNIERGRDAEEGGEGGKVGCGPSGLCGTSCFVVIEAALSARPIVG